MKSRDLLIVLILLAGAVFFFFQDEKTADEDEEERATEAKRANAQSISSRSTDADGNSRVVRSSRVWRPKPEMVTTESGLKYEILEEGVGERPGPTSKVKVHYVGTLADGTVFDNSHDRGVAAGFGLDQVIKGWAEGLQLMRPGARYRFVIPPELGYGEVGAGRAIPANATLTFEVELLEVEAE